MQMSREQIEFAISQYLDGTLNPLERAGVEARLEKDAEARALLEEYRQLDGVLKNALPEPTINWNRFASHLSDQIAHGDAPAARTYKIGAWRVRRYVAAAACVVISWSLWSHFHKVNEVVPGGNPIVATGTLSIEGPMAEVASGPAVVDIAVGPSPSLAAAEQNAQWAAAVVSRPPR